MSDSSAVRLRRDTNLAATLAVTLLSVVTAVGFCRVFSGWSFLPGYLSVVGAAHAVSAVTRWLRWPALVAVPVSLAAVAVVLGHLYYPDTLFAGLFPWRETVALARVEISDAWTLFADAVAPVPSSGGFLVVGALALGAAAVLADAFAFRAFARAEAALPTAVLFVFIAALGADRLRIAVTAAWLMAMLLAVGALRLAHGDHGASWLADTPLRRMRRLFVTVAATAAVATVVGVLVGPRLPGAGEEPLIDPDIGDRREVLSPLVDIRARLVNRSDRELFRVRANEPAYWRLTSLDVFDGTTWTSSLRLGAVNGQFAAIDGPVDRQQFEIRALGDRWIPAPAGVAFVDSPSRQLSFDEGTESLFLNIDDGELFTGMTYETLSARRQLTAEDLRSRGVAAADTRLTALPADFPDAVRQLALEITAGRSTPYDQALALQDYFHQNFTYNLDVARGHDERAIETFLRTREGYCEQFAGTFAAMARSIGIPARVAVGFTPGIASGTDLYSVLGRHAHAWPEVWFDGLGWVAFEPTPGRGAPGAEGYTGLAPDQDGGGVAGGTDTDGGPGGGDDRPPGSTVTPPNTGFSDPDAQSTTLPGQGVAPTLPPASEAPQGSAGPLFAALGAVAFAVLLWMLLMPVVVRRLRRRSADPAERVVRAWEAAARAQALLGAPRLPSETPLEHAVRASAETALARHATLDLAQRATLVVYAGGRTGEEEAAQAEALAKRVVVAGQQRASWSRRLRARLDPRLVP
jgi:transglutaminase-like putative cysteine protease